MTKTKSKSTSLWLACSVLVDACRLRIGIFVVALAFVRHNAEEKENRVDRTLLIPESWADLLIAGQFRVPCFYDLICRFDSENALVVYFQVSRALHQKCQGLNLSRLRVQETTNTRTLASVIISREGKLSKA